MTENQYQTLVRIVAEAYIRQRGEVKQGNDTPIERIRQRSHRSCECQNDRSRKRNAGNIS